MCTSLHQFKVVKRCVPCLLSDCYWQGWVKVRLSRQWKEQPRERWGRRQRDRGARGEDGQATLRRHLPLQQALWHRHTSSKAEVKGENVMNCEEDCWGERHTGFRTWQRNLILLLMNVAFLVQRINAAKFRRISNETGIIIKPPDRDSQKTLTTPEGTGSDEHLPEYIQI